MILQTAIAFLVSFLSFGQPAAPEPTLDEKIDAIIDITRLPDEMVKGPILFATMQAVSNRYEPSSKTQIEQFISTEILRLDFEIYKIFFDSMKESMTAEEIDAFYKFVTSPGGRSFIGKQSVFHDALTQAVKARQPPFVVEMIAKVEADPELQRFRK